MLHCNICDRDYLLRRNTNRESIMSKQLTFASALSIAALVALAVAGPMMCRDAADTQRHGTASTLSVEAVLAR
jgi:hypothetical protein